MSIDDYVNPIKLAKSADHWVLKQYSKLVKHYEDKGGTKRDLAEKLCFAHTGALFWEAISFASKKYISTPSPPIHLSLSEYLGAALLFAQQFSLQTHDLLYTFEGSYDSNLGRFEESRFNHYSRKFQRLARLPVLGLVGWGFYDMLTGKYSNDFDTTFGLLCQTFIFGALASSMYVKDADPKLLQEDFSFSKNLVPHKS